MRGLLAVLMSVVWYGRTASPVVAPTMRESRPSAYVNRPGAVVHSPQVLRRFADGRVVTAPTGETAQHTPTALLRGIGYGVVFVAPFWVTLVVLVLR